MNTAISVKHSTTCLSFTNQLGERESAQYDYDKTEHALGCRKQLLHHPCQPWPTNRTSTGPWAHPTMPSGLKEKPLHRNIYTGLTLLTHTLVPVVNCSFKVLFISPPPFKSVLQQLFQQLAVLSEGCWLLLYWPTMTAADMSLLVEEPCLYLLSRQLLWCLQWLLC